MNFEKFLKRTLHIAFLRWFFFCGNSENVQCVISGAQLNVYIKVHQRRIQNPAKHLRQVFVKIVNRWIPCQTFNMDLFGKIVNRWNTSQTSKTMVFAKILNGWNLRAFCKSVNHFPQKFNFRCLTRFWIRLGVCLLIFSLLNWWKCIFILMFLWTSIEGSILT